jgi:hypothetical protein
MPALAFPSSLYAAAAAAAVMASADTLFMKLNGMLSNLQVGVAAYRDWSVDSWGFKVQQASAKEN